MSSPIEHGGPNLHFGVGVPGTGARFARYILRPEAVRAQHSYPITDERRGHFAVFTRNLPELLRGGESPEEVQDVLSSFTGTAWDWELARSHGRDPGTEYYYAVATFAVGVWPTPRQAQQMSDEFLARDFGRARVIGAGHYDTGNYHANLIILARDVDGLKLQLGQQYFRMDERWAEIYLRHMEPDEERRNARFRLHMAKKAETRRFKTAIREELQTARARGRSISIEEAVQRVARTMRIPQRYVDYRRIELHPHAREAAQLVQRCATVLGLSQQIKRAADSASAQAVGWRRQMHELGMPSVVKDELLTLWLMHREDPHFLEQVQRLTGSEAFDTARAALGKDLQKVSHSLRL